MTSSIDWQIPPSVLHHLERVPKDRPVALLLRHSVRDEIPAGGVGYDLPITDVGRAIATELGRNLGLRLNRLHSSPLPRCVQTADALRLGAGSDVRIVEDRLLGDPGAYVLDGKKAWQNWESMGHEGVMDHLDASLPSLPGMARANEAARFLVHQMLAVAGAAPGVSVFVTHDSLVTPTVSHMIGQRLGKTAWPWFLEGAFFWRAEAGVHTAYREHEGVHSGSSLCSLNELDVIEFARREIAATVGLGCAARFFLAGGAFKTLLSGSPPRDLDLWAPSPADRDQVLRVLEARGARRLPDRPFADAFEISGRVVELPHKAEPPTLEGRLARFDIALSAIGVEHGLDGRWSAFIHPLAQESVRRREVLLLKPLINWRYALTTLERMRRYAAELSYTVPRHEEDEIWRVFGEQPRDVRAGMLERYRLTGQGSVGIMEEAQERHEA